MFYTYILKSLKDNKFYYGSTSNLKNRLNQHKYGKVKSTKHRRPLILHYHEQFETKLEASDRERFFKSIDGYNWLKVTKVI